MTTAKIKKAKVITTVLIFFLIIVLMFQNSDIVAIKVFFWSLEMSGILFIPLIFVTGAIFGASSSYIYLKRKAQLRQSLPATKTSEELLP